MPALSLVDITGIPYSIVLAALYNNQKVVPNFRPPSVPQPDLCYYRAGATLHKLSVTEAERLLRAHPSGFAEIHGRPLYFRPFDGNGGGVVFDPTNYDAAWGVPGPAQEVIDHVRAHWSDELAALLVKDLSADFVSTRP